MYETWIQKIVHFGSFQISHNCLQFSVSTIHSSYYHYPSKHKHILLGGFLNDMYFLHRYNIIYKFESRIWLEAHPGIFGLDMYMCIMYSHNNIMSKPNIVLAKHCTHIIQALYCYWIYVIKQYIKAVDFHQLNISLIICGTCCRAFFWKTK